MKLIASEESASSTGAASTPPTRSTKLGQLSLVHYDNPVFEITSDETKDHYLIQINKNKLEHFETLNFYITHKESKDPNAPQLAVLNIEKWSDDVQYTPLNEPQVDDQPTSTPNTVINSDHEDFDAELNEYAQQDGIELDSDLLYPPSNQINLDGNFDLALDDSPLADLRMPDFILQNEFRKLPDLDSASKQTLFKENSKLGPDNNRAPRKLIMVDEDENDDIICLDSDCEPSTQPRIKNEPIRAALAPINPNRDLIANCSPIKKRKMLDKENINPKKSKTIKDILKQDPQPAPVVIKQEIQKAKALLVAQQLQAQAKSERAPPPIVTKYDYKAGVPAQLQASLPPPVPAPKKNEKTEPNQAGASAAKPQQEVETNDLEHFENDENVDLVPVESYVSYKPKKLDIGSEHPDVIVETTSLASVEPPEITYSLKMPSAVIETNKLSALQLEAVVYACQTHETFLPNKERRGFLIGDGAGVGKGRTIAGIILENIKQKRKKAIWFSVSNDLKLDAKRDLNDIGISDEYPIKGLIDFVGYKPIKMEKGVIFSTYQALISKSKRSPTSRLNQLINWVGGESFDGLIIFDESHKAKNLVPEKGSKPTQCGQAVKEIQARLPNARIVYASATGATDCKNLAYMNRLGLWGPEAPFSDFIKFQQFIDKTGVSAMEVVALDLKWQGIFLARQLSFTGATFRIQEVELEKKYLDIYDRSVKLWVKIKAYMQNVEELTEKKSRGMTAYWGAHQRFFRYLCIASKVNETVRLAKEAVAEGRSVVIGLQSTGEAQTTKQNVIESDALSSTAYGVLKDIIATMPDAGNLPTSGWTMTNGNTNDDDDGEDDSDENETSNQSWPGMNLMQRNNGIDLMQGILNTRPPKNSFRVRDEYNNMSEEMAKDAYVARLSRDLSFIHREAAELKKILPPNTLDELVDELGGPENVAEMTGRKMMQVCTNRDDNDDDENDENVVKTKKYALEKRTATDQKTMNIDEKNAFMNGEKQIAIISDAASCGISLQAHKDFANKSRRLHITLELPWSADKAIQQFGRTHRSNQVCAPDYVFLISKLAGEKRFASSVAKRIESMNAITHGDRNATKSRDLSGFNMESKHGNKAITKIIHSIFCAIPIDSEIPVPRFPNFFVEAKQALNGVDLLGKATKAVTVKTFLNRLLGCNVEIQNALFNYFESALEAEIALAKKEGRFDEGINDMDLSNRDILNHFIEEYTLKDKRKVDLHFICVKIGSPWHICEETYKKNITDGINKNGFYFPYEGRNYDVPYLAVQSSTGLGKYWMYSPLIGKLKTKYSEEELRTKFKKANLSMDRIKVAWENHYKRTESQYVNVLGGSILTIFLKINTLFQDKKGLSMVRVHLGDNKRIIGISIPYTKIDRVKATLKDFIGPVERD